MDHRPERLSDADHHRLDTDTDPDERPTNMLLSRVAESVYWAGRYLERAESTARILRVHTELFLDLPKSAGLTWGPLLAIAGDVDEFDSRYPGPSEEHVCTYLVSDADNPGSVLSALALARENMRTTRAVFPREAWELLNHVYLRALEQCEAAVARNRRIPWTNDVISGCQALSGMLADTMSRDDAYSFLLMGRLLERADMTTRVLDVRAEHLMTVGDRLDAYTEVMWMGVLKSLAAYQMYRRQVQTRVQGAEALRFLLQDPLFPRSIEHCLVETSTHLAGLSHHDEPTAVCTAARTLLAEAKIRSLAWDGLHDFADDLQLRIADLHAAIDETYFVNVSTSKALRATA